MAEFLLELFVPRADASAVERCSELARRGADELAGEGTRVRYLRTIFVPEDETCFLMYEAASADVVRSAAGRVALRFERIAETFSGSKDDVDEIARLGQEDRHA